MHCEHIEHVAYNVLSQLWPWEGDMPLRSASRGTTLQADPPGF